MATATENLPSQAENQPRQLTLRQQLESPQFHSSIAKVLPRHVTPERMVRVAIMAMTRTPKLRECDPNSFFRCMMDLSAWGLEPDGRRAHLIPFENKKRGVTECQLIIDYKGLAELVMRSGVVSNIHADVVCENDVFEYDRGELKKHKIDFRQPRGEPYAAYCLVRMKDGSEKCEVVTKEDILAIRDRSQGWMAFKKGWAKQSPWDPKVPHSEREMWKKTAFRRVSKWLPLSAEIRDAAEVDDDAIDVSSVVREAKPRETLDDLTDRLIGSDIDTTGVDRTDEGTEPEGDDAEPGDTLEAVPTYPPLTEIFAKVQSIGGCDDKAEALMTDPECTFEEEAIHAARDARKAEIRASKAK